MFWLRNKKISFALLFKLKSCWDVKQQNKQTKAGANPGFLERGFIYIKVWGGLALLIDFI